MKTWQLYVTRLARDVWRLDPPATNRVLRQFEDLISEDALTDETAKAVLAGVGVAESMAALTASSIRGASSL